MSLVSSTKFPTKCCWGVIYHPMPKWLSSRLARASHSKITAYMRYLSCRAHKWWDHCVISSYRGFSASSCQLVIPQQMISKVLQAVVLQQPCVGLDPSEWAYCFLFKHLTKRVVCVSFRLITWSNSPNNFNSLEINRQKKSVGIHWFSKYCFHVDA